MVDYKDFVALESTQEKLMFIQKKWLKSSEHTLKLFEYDPHKRRLVYRAPWNPCRNKALEAMYEKTLEQKGLVACFRGKMVSQPSPNPQGPDYRWFSVGGTITDVLYNYVEKNPESKFAKLVIATGIPNTMDFHSNLPQWAAEWLKFEANDVNGGARYTPWESLTDCEDAENKWTDHKLQNGITVRKCPAIGEHSYQRQKE